MPTLDWLARDAAFRVAEAVPTRVLRPHTAGHAFGEPGNSGNLLIQGDNLAALKALLPFYRGRVKCIFIDPPYNTKSAFEHYDDNLEHSQWLSMMLPRLQLLRELLSEDGSIWVTIDDNEGHYLKVLMDEVFGRGNFVANVIWEKKFAPQANSVWLSDSHDHVLTYAKSKERWKANLLPRDDAGVARYKNPDGDPRGLWMSDNFTISLSGGQRGAQYAKTGQSTNIYKITTPGGRKLLPSPGRCWRTGEDRFRELMEDNRIWFGPDGNNVPRFKTFLSEVQDGVVAKTVWRRDDVGDNQDGKREVMKFNSEQVFATPKPERLIHRVIHVATNPNDLVLDSFLGSGTTAAVAHKMGRRWIGIEMGEHAVSHCLPRLQKVVEGEPGGISKAVNWQGGGGFRMLTLGAPLFGADGEIDPDVRYADLAAFLWMRETGTALDAANAATGLPLIGVHTTPEPGRAGTAYYLLFNGILGDRRPAGGNVLTGAVLAALRELCWHAGPKVVYGEACRLGDARLAAEGIVFKQLPHAVPK